MFVIELHDGEVDNLAEGTLAGTCGRHGGIEYDYQVEMSVQEVIDQGWEWRRAYVVTGERVRVIWMYDKATGEVRYLARTTSYTGEWQLPFVGSPDAQIAVGVWGRDASTDDEAHAWAEELAELIMLARVMPL